MSSYAKWQADLAFRPLQGKNGRAFTSSFGALKDEEAERARQAALAHFPGRTPSDGLVYLSNERMLERGGNELEADFRARLENAWALWQFGGTAQGILAALTSLGYTATIVATSPGYDRGPAGPFRFWVVITGTSYSGDGIWTDPGVWAPDGTDGGAWDSTATLQQVDQLRRIVSRWKAAHTKCVAIVLDLGGGYLSFLEF